MGRVLYDIRTAKGRGQKIPRQMRIHHAQGLSRQRRTDPMRRVEHLAILNGITANITDRGVKAKRKRPTAQPQLHQPQTLPTEPCRDDEFLGTVPKISNQ
eukprot:gene13515-biopygen68